MENLKQALEKMPYTFTSHMFCRVAANYGLTKRDIDNGVVAYFLKQNCNQLSSKRSWAKKTAGTNTIFQTSTLEEAIKMVKDAGYKVMKPVNEWQEV